MSLQVLLRASEVFQGIFCVFKKVEQYQGPTHLRSPSSRGQLNQFPEVSESSLMIELEVLELDQRC